MEVDIVGIQESVPGSKHEIQQDNFFWNEKIGVLGRYASMPFRVRVRFVYLIGTCT